jgi:hypothetical protein
VGPQDSPKRLNRKPIARQNQMLCGQIGHRFLQPVCDLSQMGSIFVPLDQCDIGEF